MTLTPRYARAEEFLRQVDDDWAKLVALVGPRELGNVLS